MTEEKRPPAFRILILLYDRAKRYRENSRLPREERDPDVHYWVYPFDMAEELGIDLGKTLKTLTGLKSLGMARKHTDGMWGFEGGPTFDFLNGVSGEFNQSILKGELGISQPTASRRMRLLSDLGLIEVSRVEAVPVTGGRRLWFRRA